MKRLLLLPVLLSLALAQEPRGCPDFHKVDDNIYRGRQPKAEGFQALADMGIKTVIDLRGGWIHSPHERKLVQAAGMRYVTVRLSGIFAPKDKQIAKLLSVMEDPSAQPVFLHCRRGADRIGVVVACYRIAHDHWSNDKAFDEARSLGLSPFEVLMRRYIRHYRPAAAQAPAVVQ